MDKARRDALIDLTPDAGDQSDSDDTDSEEKITESDHETDSEQSESETEHEGTSTEGFFYGRGSQKAIKGEENSFKWKKTPFKSTKTKKKNIVKFKAGLTDASAGISDEISAFEKIFDSDMLEPIVHCTNLIIQEKRLTGKLKKSKKVN